MGIQAQSFLNVLQDGVLKIFIKFVGKGQCQESPF